MSDEIDKKIEKEIESQPVKRKKQKKEFPVGNIYVQCSFNNTVVSITDLKGNVISWSSAGKKGFKGARKSTPFASQIAAEDAGKIAYEKGMRTASVYINGPGAGRETALRGIIGTGIKINYIRDTTPIPHNGCRSPKKRRV